jgi:hypothetical protein
VEGLAQHSLASLDDARALVAELRRARGQSRRNTHAVVTFTLTFPAAAGSDAVASRVHVVDLAGSGTSSSSSSSGSSSSSSSSSSSGGGAASGDRSLQTVGRVVSALAKGAEACAQLHVPFGDAALTRLLAASLRHRRGVCALLAAVRPDAADYEETLATLR